MHSTPKGPCTQAKSAAGKKMNGESAVHANAARAGLRSHARINISFSKKALGAMLLCGASARTPAP